MDNKNLSFMQLKQMAAKAKEAKQQYFLDMSKKRLEKVIATKIRTTFIGAIANFEESFG